MPVPLEDNFEDVVGKAMRGLRLSEAQVAQQAGVAAEAVETFQRGGTLVDSAATEKIATVLGLNYSALRDLAAGTYQPGDLDLPPTLAAFNQPFSSEMTVNFYLAWDQEGGQAAAFDTGGDCGPLLAKLREHNLKLGAIFLTHTHEDHIADLGRLVKETGAPVYVSEREKMAGHTGIKDGQTFSVGRLTITARSTPGHSPGGITYVVAGIEPQAAVVGDALFAGSMGGVSPQNYASALEANQKNILALPEDTILCPGHGPVTTVAAERTHNPFYAGNAANRDTGEPQFT